MAKKLYFPWGTFGHTPLELATEVSKWYILKFDVVMVIKQFHSLNYAELCLCNYALPFFNLCPYNVEIMYLNW